MQTRIFYFGTHYHPERYPFDDVLLGEDIALLERLHMNTVLLAAEAVHGGGTCEDGSWFFGLLDRLQKAGIAAGVALAPALLGTELLSALDANPGVAFFYVEERVREEALGLAAAAKKDGLMKPVSVFISEETLFDEIHAEDAVDIPCFSHRPDWSGTDLYGAGCRMAFLEDRARSIRGGAFFLSDIDPLYLINEKGRKRKRPGLLTLEIFQASIHEARGVFFSEFRQAVSGETKYDGAILDHLGRTDTDRFREIAEIGRLFGEVAEMAPTCVDARCAVWCGDASALDCAYRIWRILRRSGISVDLIDGSAGIERYLFIAACGVRRVSREKAERLRAYLEGGGTLLATWGFATEDEAGTCYRGTVPHALSDVFGLEVLAQEELFADEEVPLAVPADFKGRHSARRVVELIENRDADVIVRCDGGPFKGAPALLRKSVGRGFAYYMGTDCDDVLLMSLCEKLLKVRRGIPPMKMEEGIAVQRLFGESAEYLVFQNYTDKTKKLPLVYNKLDILFGSDPLSAYGALVLRVPKKRPALPCTAVNESG